MFPESHALWVSYTLFGLLDGDFCTYTAIEKQIGVYKFWNLVQNFGDLSRFWSSNLLCWDAKFCLVRATILKPFWLEKDLFLPESIWIMEYGPNKIWDRIYLRRIWVGYFLWPISHMMCSSIFAVQCGLVDLLWHFNLGQMFTQYISLSFIFRILTWNIENTHRKWVCLVSFLVSYFFILWKK